MRGTPFRAVCPWHGLNQPCCQTPTLHFTPCYVMYLHRSGEVHEMDASQAHNAQAGFIRCLAASPDGAYLLSGADDKTAKLWCLKTRTCLATW